jgi:hypothetical protein
MSWLPAYDGSTLGQMGPAGAVITRDELLRGGPEDEERARLTLEEDPSRGLYALTGYLAGWLLHTCYLADAPTAAAELEAMRAALETLLVELPAQGPKDAEARRQGGVLLARFLGRFA